MKIKELIMMLENEYNKQEKCRYHNGEDIYGEPEIMIDMFDLDDKNNIIYCGIDKNIKITSSPDGVYRILTAWKGVTNDDI